MFFDVIRLLKIAFKQQEEKIKKSIEQIAQNKAVLKKQKQDLKQTQDCIFV